MTAPTPELLEGPCLYIFRHGQTEWNRQRRIQGLADIPLNEEGRSQAKAYASLLKAHCEACGQELPSAGIISSPLLRAKETAQILASSLGLSSLSCDERLREQNYGDWEGQTLEEVKAFFPETWQSFFKNPATRPPNGESIGEVCERVRPLVDGLRAGTIVVSHFSAIFGMLLGRWKGYKENLPLITQRSFFRLFDWGLLEVSQEHLGGKAHILAGES